MSSKFKIILLVLFVVLVGVNIIIALFSNDIHEEIDIANIEEANMYYRYSVVEKNIDVSLLQSLVNDFNSSENYEKVYSEELPCYSITLSLKNGVKVVFVDIHTDDSILVERVFFGKTTKYELHDTELIQTIKKLIEDNFDLHENEVCKKYL